MSKPELIKRSGWFFIAGAFAFVTILTGGDPITIPGSVISAILLAMGMSNLRKGFSESIGSVGRNMLLLGTSAPVLWFVIMVSMALIFSSSNLTDADIDAKSLWIPLFAGPAISLLGLTLYGLAALVSKPMPRLNGLPLFAGIWYPVTYVLYTIFDIANHGLFPDKYLPALVLMVVIQFIALCRLGIVLIEDSSKELVAA